VIDRDNRHRGGHITPPAAVLAFSGICP
jgi:hypothetical protein